MDFFSDNEEFEKETILAGCQNFVQNYGALSSLEWMEN